MSGMGTYLTIVPVFTGRKPPEVMMRWGLNTEHHAAPGPIRQLHLQPGRPAAEVVPRHVRPRGQGSSGTRRQGRVHRPRLGNTGRSLQRLRSSPLHRHRSAGVRHRITSGVIIGLKLDTTRGDILKGIMEGVVFYHKTVVDSVAEAGIALRELRAVGGGQQVGCVAADFRRHPGQAHGARPGLGGRLPRRGDPCRRREPGHSAAWRRACGRWSPSVSASSRIRRGSAPTRRRYEHYRALWPLMKDFLRT